MTTMSPVSVTETLVLEAQRKYNALRMLESEDPDFALADRIREAQGELDRLKLRLADEILAGRAAESTLYDGPCCDRAQLAPGQRVPLLHGSAETEHCGNCGKWRIPCKLPGWSGRWRPAEEFAEALKENEEQ